MGAIRQVQATSAGLTIVTTAYTSGDQLGTEMTFDVGNGLACGGIIRGATLLDEGDVVTDVDLLLFGSATTPAANNAAAAWSDVDMRKSQGFIRLTDDVDFGGARLVMPAVSTGMCVPFRTNTGTLYVDMVTRSANAVFTAVTDLVVSLFVEIN